MAESSRWGSYGIAVAIGLLVLLAYLTWGPETTTGLSPVAPASPPDSAASRRNAVASTICGEVAEPTHGSVQVHDAEIMKRSDANYSGIEFINDSPSAVRITLVVPGSEHRLASIFVSTRQRAVLSAPTGSYGLQVERGSIWCGDTGFRDAVQIAIRDGLNTRDGQIGEVAIAASPDLPTGLSFRFRSKPPASSAAELDSAMGPVLGEGTLEVRADRAGHYRIPGMLNTKAVSFLVDTGASMVAVSRRVANEAGLYECAHWAKVKTANGTVDVCIVRGVNLRFGGFVLTQTDIAVLPNLETDALLGMNVLRQFRVEWAQDVLKISAK